MEKEFIETICNQLKRIEQTSLLAAKEMLTLEDVALITGLSKSYLYHLTSSKEIPHYKPKGGTIFISKTDLLQWQKKCKVEGNNQIEEMALKKCNYGK